MDMQKTIQTEALIASLEGRLGPVLDADYREALFRARNIMAEVRHFAVTWMDALEIEKECRASAKDIREEAITRLVQTIRPD